MTMQHCHCFPIALRILLCHTLALPRSPCALQVQHGQQAAVLLVPLPASCSACLMME
jgi:hypothetical protein